MTEREFHIAVAATLIGFVFAAAVIFAGDVAWRIRQARRDPWRRKGSIFEERR